MSYQRLLTYWLEYTDEGVTGSGPLGPTAVRHDNNDLVLAVQDVARSPGERDAAMLRWRLYWERQTGRQIAVRLLDTFAPVD